MPITSTVSPTCHSEGRWTSGLDCFTGFPIAGALTNRAGTDAPRGVRKLLQKVF